MEEIRRPKTTYVRRMTEQKKGFGIKLPHPVGRGPNILDTTLDNKSANRIESHPFLSTCVSTPVGSIPYLNRLGFSSLSMEYSNDLARGDGRWETRTLSHPVVGMYELFASSAR